MRPISVAHADLDGDGHRDLIVANIPGPVSVMRGNGDGTFAPPVGYDGGVGIRWVAAGDFNGDAKHDVAVVNIVHQTVTVLLNSW